jgi:hypothetical protein
LVGDGIKVSKEGKKMPGVKHLHQSADSNTKAEYIMGHSCQAVAFIGEKVALKDRLADVENMIEIDSPVYGDKDIKLKCAAYDLLWKPVGKLVRFVVVVHPTRGSCILMSSETACCGVVY